MARLKAMPSRLTTPPSRLSVSVPVGEAGQSRQRDRDQPIRRNYKTARWQRLRWSVLLRDLFTCRRCRRLEADTSQLVADHIIPHRGDETLFWNDANLQCLCKSCHDSTKQSEERNGYR